VAGNCASCAAVLEPGVRFCAACGRRVEAVEIPAPPQPVADVTRDPRPHTFAIKTQVQHVVEPIQPRRDGLPWKMLALSGLVIAAVGMTSYFVVHFSTSSHHSVPAILGASQQLLVARHPFATVAASGPEMEYAVLHSFSGPDGARPMAPLVQGTNGNFYGTTSEGGLNDHGVVFEMDAAGRVTVLHAFSGGDGTRPSGGLIQAIDGYLYGTTESNVFRLDLSGGFTVLHKFAASREGDGSWSALVEGSGGVLYGTNMGGGLHGRGTVFMLRGTDLAVLHSFEGPDGDGPLDLIEGDDGDLYGITGSGGPEVDNGYPKGTIFKMDMTGQLSVLYSFNGPAGMGNGRNGTRPLRLLQAEDGRLFGITSGGGGDRKGVVFTIDHGGDLRVLHSFGEHEGEGLRGLALGGKPYIFGSTSRGVFRMSDTGDLTRLLSFDPEQRATYCCSVMIARDGHLYGTTWGGGPSDKGVVYRLTNPASRNVIAK
jgi:uncharacterized repeat protein (TIGR03803 family)